ncbi:MAG: biopolymer transporter ExbD [Bacteriovoracaceae bacterium]|nr:biopolymer transporter ExbD [Bacteriovoracaceae bacterium]
MYKTPSSRRKKRNDTKLNLAPVLDAIFIFIFFLLMSASFSKIYEIASDVPMVSNSEPPKNHKPLALTIKVYEKGFYVYTGVPSQRIKIIPKQEAKYDTEGLHKFLVEIKKKNTKENSAILEPVIDITYEELVLLMDSVRMLRPTDDDIYGKDKEGIDVRIKELFSEIVFGNIQS